MASSHPHEGALARLIREWAREWGLPGFEEAISLSFSPRLSRSLGRAVPATGRIVVSSFLVHGPLRPLADVVCHEAAHVAAFLLSGSVSSPHGPLWQELVSAAGFRPRLRRAVPGVGDRKTRQSGVRLLYEHRCPVCQSVWFARRPVSRWRCTECALAGLAGELVVVRHQDGR